MIRLRWCLAVAFLSLPLVAPQQGASPKSSAKASAPVQSWETSWEVFVETYNKCIKDDACDRKQFVGKEVTWNGRVKQVLLEKSGVQMDMGGPPLQDKTGKTVDVLVFWVKPTSGQEDKWKDVSSSQMVRFRTKIATGIADSVVGYMVMAGQGWALFNTEGGEFLGKLQDSK
jgi:hypothetical protein